MSEKKNSGNIFVFITVVCDNCTQFEKSLKSFVDCSKSHDVSVKWFVVANHSKRALSTVKRDLNKIKRLVLFESQIELVILDGSKNTSDSSNSGSYHHSQGLHFGIVEAAKLSAISYVILDPDIYFKDAFFGKKILFKAAKRRFTGSMWDPLHITHDSTFPSPHFMIVKKSEDLLRLDFTPDGDENYSRKKNRISVISNKISSSIIGKTILANYLKAFLLSKYIGINEDTGHRNKSLFSKKGGRTLFKIRPFFIDPAAPNFIKRMRQHKSYSKKLSDRISLISKTMKLYETSSHNDNLERHYSNNEVIIEHSRNTINSQKIGKRRIFIANMVPAFQNTLQGDIGFYKFLKNYCEVDFGICSGGARACLNRKFRPNTNSEDWAVHPGACSRCDSNLEKFLKTSVENSDIIDMSIKKKARLKGKLQKKGKGTLYRDISVGEHAYSATCRYFGFGRPEIFPDFDEIFDEFLVGACEYADRLLIQFSKVKYDCVICHHGIYVPQGIVVDVAKIYQIPVVTWNLGYRKNTFYFGFGDTYHKTFPLINIPASKKLNQEQRGIIYNYIESRKTAINDWLWFTNNKDGRNESVVVNDKIREIANGKKIISVIPNVFWDAQGHFKEAIFSDMYEFLDTVKQISSAHKDWIFIVRPHPAELNGSSKSSILTSEWYKEQNSENFVVLEADSVISSIELSNFSEFSIAYASKIIGEISATGKTVLVAGEALAKNKGFTIDPKSKEEFCQSVEKCINGFRLNANVVKDRAYVFLYTYYFEWTLEFFNFTSKSINNQPKIEFDNEIPQESLLKDPGFVKLWQLIWREIKNNERKKKNI